MDCEREGKSLEGVVIDFGGPLVPDVRNYWGRWFLLRGDELSEEEKLLEAEYKSERNKRMGVVHNAVLGLLTDPTIGDQLLTIVYSYHSDEWRESCFWDKHQYVKAEVRGRLCIGQSPLTGENVSSYRDGLEVQKKITIGIPRNSARDGIQRDYPRASFIVPDEPHPHRLSDDANRRPRSEVYATKPNSGDYWEIPIWYVVSIRKI